jgi:23S rRNA (cytidine1920-2'-O)/16S rRNA (cytidine1409-2'-O)-methyltransferase
MAKQRIDQLLVSRGFAASRTKAQAMVMSGVVLAGERRVEKPSETVQPDVDIRIKGDSPEGRYVSRAGLKLEAAIDHFGIDAGGTRCIDIGSSTGGFTDCLLTRGARHVTAVDSGTNQLVWKLREDPRVEVRERTNARHLEAADVGDDFDVAVMDLSFISVTKVMPAIVPLIRYGGTLIVLIKPQFEVGKGEVGKGGIVREPEKHQRVIEEIERFARELGLKSMGVIDSPILGAEGNKEFLACYEIPQRTGRS